ncbi:MAG: DUF2804 domain-containing protein [Bacilli bacterium]|nr:DUF2804 domain-containing protein [Bacilli bacterium]
MEQNLLQQGPLLDKKGHLIEAGYAFDLVKQYDRKAIKAPKWRIKEWDYYYIGNNHYGIAITIDDNSYMGLASVSLLNFDKPNYITRSSMRLFTNGKINLPSSSANGVSYWKDKNYEIKIVTENRKRLIDLEVKNYVDKKGLLAHFELTEKVDGSMVIATPFPKKPKHFYYNQKINNMVATGYFFFNDERIYFSEEDTRAVLDWGRGVWTYKNTWYWSSLNAKNNGHEVGFNFGYGFGDLKAASENMLFYDGKAYKLKDVTFNVPRDSKGNYRVMQKWTITSKDGGIDLTFEPIIDRKDSTNFIVLKSIQHQVFGKFSGKIKVDDLEVEIVDAVSFAEIVTNWW